VEFKKLAQETSVSLIANFTYEEIKEAVWQCECSKSPGPDGFNFNFIKENWVVLKEEVVEAVKSFQELGCIPKGCNASFIALVPKVKDPLSLDQYKPIYLVGSLYKIITKVLLNRIKEVLPMVIDDNQSAFLKDRGMLDSVLVANEVVEELRRNERRGLCLKVDYEKAYDSVRWDFLLYMLLLGQVSLFKMPTRSGLSRRGVLVSHVGCEMCRTLKETSQHLFFECAIAQWVWSLCFRWIGILGVQHKNLKVHFESFDLAHLNSYQKQVWKGMWAAIVRGI